MLYRNIKESAFTFIAIFLLQFTLPITSTANSDAAARDLINRSSKAWYNLTIANGLVTLDAENADLQSILKDIRKRTNIQIESYENIHQRITISFQKLTIDKAIRKISKNSGMVFAKKKGEEAFHLSRVVITGSSSDQIEIRREDAGRNSTTMQSKYQNLSRFKAANKTAGPVNDTAASLINPEISSGALPQSVANELIVQFSPEVSSEAVKALAARVGGNIKEHISPLDYYVLTLPKGISVDRTLSQFNDMKQVQYAEPNYLIPLQSMPNDPLFFTQWAFNHANQGETPEQTDIKLTAAWDLERGNPGMVIAVIDTGIDYNHEDLSANIWHNSGEIPGNGIDDDHNGYVDDFIGWDFVDAQSGADDEDFSGPDNDPLDRHGHGTLVSGIVAAAGNNGIGITGVTWYSKIMPVRAAYKTKHWGAILESDDAARAIIYAAENGAHVINLSWGSQIQSKLIESAIMFAADSGVLVCAAAGNNNTNAPFYPADLAYDAIIAVGATDKDGKKALMSNFGEWVDVSAPGVSMNSTYLSNQYAFQTGTSVAVAVISGIAGLIWSWIPDLTYYEVKSAIINSGDPTDTQGGTLSRVNRVNAYTALIHAKLRGSANHWCREGLSMNTNEIDAMEDRVAFSANEMLQTKRIVYQSIFSDESTGMQITNEEYLRLLYSAVFGRNPDPEGFWGWLHLLNGSELGDNIPREYVLNSFVNSEEFIIRCDRSHRHPH